MEDYRDTTVLIPVKDEPAVEKVTKGVLSKLPACKVIVVYKGRLGMKLNGKNLRILKQSGSGKGAACVQAAKLVDTDIMCFIDGDNTYDVNDLKKVIALVREGAAMAIGNRFSNISSEAMPPYIQFGNNMLTLTANVLYGLRIKDSQTGLRAIRKDIFDRLGVTETHFGIEEEMNIKTKKLGLKIAETPINYYVRVGESKQFKLVDGLRLLFINFKFIFW